MICEESGAELRVVPIDDRGQVDSDTLINALDETVVLLAVAHVSNALGTVNPVEEWIAAAHARDIPVLVDGAQAVPHMAVDVRALDADFYTFSGHKMCGPTGIGILYARESLLDAMPPWQGGGDMILEVSFSGTTYNELPYKFEAGTPNIAGGVGLGAAIDYLASLGMEAIAAHERRVLAYATEKLSQVDGLRIIGSARDKAAVVSFTLGEIHAHDLGTIVDHYGVALRTGHHCTMPVMQFFNVPATARASFGMYNTVQEVDVLVEALEQARSMF
jgi:cysteine desulfurase/selenocysteine lyase